MAKKCLEISTLLQQSELAGALGTVFEFQRKRRMKAREGEAEGSSVLSKTNSLPSEAAVEKEGSAQ